MDQPTLRDLAAEEDIGLVIAGHQKGRVKALSCTITGRRLKDKEDGAHLADNAMKPEL